MKEQLAQPAVGNAESIDPLFTPVSINGKTVKNRFALPAMQRASFRFRPTDRMVELLRNAAEGGAGLIIAEGSSPDHPAAYWQQIFSVIGQDTIEDWRRVVDVVLSVDNVVFLMQLWHPGSLRLVTPAMQNPYPHYPTLSPSGLVRDGLHNGIAMTEQHLEETKQAYVQGALTAQQLGAHGVELHACHGYLLDQFLWHETNKRTDEYGGSTLAERAAYPAEIVEAIREATGPDFIISFRFSQWKEIDYNARIAERPDDLKPFLERMERAGVDLFNVSTRRFDAPAWPELDEHRSLAAWVKSMANVPVLAIGSVGLSTDWARDLFDNQEPHLQIEHDLYRVRRGLEEDDFDLIAAGRAQVANPQLVNLIREGAFTELQSFNKVRDLGSVDEHYVVEGQLVHELRKTD
ncbi:12-oxophytodienoate reductase [Microbacterium sp. LMI12-1-1.1]|uniref:oxidoreductase n=1 Tax=Microbacterium sp. LMI12-1-1.1 TaxID=3135225 RepID=UPI003438E886